MKLAMRKVQDKLLDHVNACLRLFFRGFDDHPKSCRSRRSLSVKLVKLSEEREISERMMQKYSPPRGEIVQYNVIIVAHSYFYF